MKPKLKSFFSSNLTTLVPQIENNTLIKQNKKNEKEQKHNLTKANHKNQDQMKGMCSNFGPLIVNGTDE